MHKTVEHVCSHINCRKKYLVGATRLRKNSKNKPKYCSYYCYGQARILPPGEARRRRLARSKAYHHNVTKKKKALTPSLAPVSF